MSTANHAAAWPWGRLGRGARVAPTFWVAAGPGRSPTRLLQGLAGISVVDQARRSWAAHACDPWGFGDGAAKASAWPMREARQASARIPPERAASR